jgi:quinol---cytochrome c reductase iron-sulfur subunit, bacillus type
MMRSKIYFREMQERFFKVVITVLSLFIVAVLFYSFGGNLVTLFYQKGRKNGFIEASGFSSLAEELPTKLYIELVEEDAFLKQTKIEDIWVIKHSPTKATVFSPICPHLGCRYAWDPNKNEFICPCHLSIFTMAGKVISGPAPRPLDTLPFEIKDGKLYVKWEVFKPGLPKKVELYSCPLYPEKISKVPLIFGLLGDVNVPK